MTRTEIVIKLCVKCNQQKETFPRHTKCIDCLIEEMLNRPPTPTPKYTICSTCNREYLTIANCPECGGIDFDV